MNHYCLRLILVRMSHILCANQMVHSMHEIGTSYWSQLEPIHRIQLTDSNRRLLSGAKRNINMPYFSEKIKNGSFIREN